MEFTVLITDDHKFDPDTEKDKRTYRKLRSNRPGTRLKFNVFVDRSTKQCRMLWAIYKYMRFASEVFSKKYATSEAMHDALVWEYCFMCPEYLVDKKVYIDGKMVDAKVRFSYSLSDGVDSEGANQYVSWVLNDFAQILKITVEQLKQESEKHRKYEA
jgi:hypothetical protein